MQSSKARQMISNFEKRSLELLGDVNVAVAEFVKILELAAKNSLQLGNVKKNRTPKSQIWYDIECHNLKKKLNHVSNQKHKNPLDENIRLDYHYLNKKYKGLLRGKKRIHQNVKMKELVNTNNPNQFWSTKQINSQDKSIPVDRLFNHFQRLHSKPDLSHYSDEQRDITKDQDEKERRHCSSVN